MYNRQYFGLGDVVRFNYNGYGRSGKVVRLDDHNVTIRYRTRDVTDGAEVEKIKTFSFYKISGLETLQMAP